MQYEEIFVVRKGGRRFEAMAQGSGKLPKSKKSTGSQKRKVVAKKKVSKGRKLYATKGQKGFAAKQGVETTKAINRKNEATVAARAIGAGDRFFLNDIKEVGKKELNQQTKERSKKERNAHKLTDRIKDQLRQLGRDV